MACLNPTSLGATLRLAHRGVAPLHGVLVVADQAPRPAALAAAIGAPVAGRLYTELHTTPRQPRPGVRRAALRRPAQQLLQLSLQHGNKNMRQQLQDHQPAAPLSRISLLRGAGVLALSSGSTLLGWPPTGRGQRPKHNVRCVPK
jgi:hypothetical protein